MIWRGLVVGLNMFMWNSISWRSYSNRLSSSWSWDRADYNVVFKNDGA